MCTRDRYNTVREDFYEQMISEIKIPGRLNPRIRTWKARTDRRNEALDCTVYAVYLSRHLRLHLRRPGQWDMDELRQRQGVLISIEPPADPPTDPDPDTPPEAAPDHNVQLLDMVQTPALPADQPAPDHLVSASKKAPLLILSLIHI